ncbi:hypothetical protein NDR87_26620 [Nocardia sp. CDC159]|uniref:Uncharacterized protein n=1 Tax=Nocardia pulmonis TaxID=2951408 RepID=A0A9X2IYH9_9NOCA|nr:MULTISPECIES: hypothetical protein [Nocardia]MCM6777067.1 hypothetical protein [Nocardia pulmonis]MCM6789952.1 hypothetical protein [Nocardia sp. CDC159]
MTESEAGQRGRADAPDAEQHPPSYISYEEFGRRFLEYAASEQRIAGAFNQLTGTAFDFGPIGAGPGKLAKVSAQVQLGEPRLTRQLGTHIEFDLAIPLSLDMTLDLAVDKHRYEVEGHVRIHLTVRTAEPLRVIIDIAEPRPGDVRIDVDTDTKRGQLVRIVAGVDHEIRRFVARYIAREIRKPHIAAARDIDVATRLDAAWKL